jgi:hypothetical protein
MQYPAKSKDTVLEIKKKTSSVTLGINQLPVL